MLQEKNRATLVGLLAPVCWGMSVGLIRSLEEVFGMAQGLTICYVIGMLFTLFVFGIPHLSKYSKKYLFLGVPLSVICSLCFTFSLQFSAGGRQTLEVGMVNYLWPSLTVICAVLFNHQKARWYVAVGFLFTLAGLGLVLAGGHGFHPLEIAGHIAENPIAYGLAALGAVAWSLFSSASRAWGNGQNPTPIIFGLDALIFAGIFISGGLKAPAPTWNGFLLCVAAGCVFGGAYAVWTYGIQKGSMTILAIGSYFTPVLSCLLGALMLGATLTLDFWQGVALVVIGSFICWMATREEKHVTHGRPIRFRRRAAAH